STVNKPMRIACIIMAHKNPQQIERFIKKFDSFPFDFFLHIDKKINPKPFHYLAQLPRVQFVHHRVKIRWASYNFVYAALLCMKEILNGHTKYDFISVMSGQDYPIKPVAELYSVLEKNRDKNFICFEEQGDWWNHAITRIKKYHFTNFGFLGKYRLQFLMNTILPDRKFPLPYALYGGPRAMCMTLGADCAKYIVHFMDSNKPLQRFIRLTWGPDEFLVPTLIMNSAFRETVVNNNFYYIDWSKGGVNPKTLTTEDYNMLVASDKLLARKFDMAEDAGILDMLDNEIM
ncbi:MAG: beta-1,6-N-acetylglucosaminyltransferase, partial [Chitinophagales bacterium]